MGAANQVEPGEQTGKEIAEWRAVRDLARPLWVLTGDWRIENPVIGRSLRNGRAKAVTCRSSG